MKTLDIVGEISFLRIPLDNFTKIIVSKKNEMKGQIKILNSSTVMSLSKMLRKVPETEEDLLSFYLQLQILMMSFEYENTYTRMDNTFSKTIKHKLVIIIRERTS